MTDIVAFLTACLDEDEATARWSGPARIAWLTYRNDDGEMRYTTVASTHDEEHWAADGRELAIPTSVRVVWDPNRVLREVAAKRKLIELHQITAVPEKWGDLRWPEGANDEGARLRAYGQPTGRTVYRCVICDLVSADMADDPDHGYRVRELPGCKTLLALASIYADRPGYQEGWKV